MTARRASSAPRKRGSRETPPRNKRVEYCILPPTIEETHEIDTVFAGFPVGIPGQLGSFALYTTESRQYVAYYNADRNMCVAARELGGSSWTRIALPEQLRWDSHNYVTLALDRTGCVHVSGNMHASPLCYFRSAAPHDVMALQRVEGMVGVDEDKVSYPMFLHDADGSLVYSYRDGLSGAGNQIYNIYDPETRSWRRLHSTPFVDGEGLRSPYFQRPVKGPDGCFHVCWVWRDAGDAATNHSLSYARSRDLRRWETSGGNRLDLPITLDRSEIVDPVEPGQGMVNNNHYIGFDTKGRAIVSYHKFDEYGNTQVYQARRESDGWVMYQTTDWNYRWDFAERGSIMFELQLSPVQVDQDGRLIQCYRHAVYGSGTLVLDEETLRPSGHAKGSLHLPPELLSPRSSFPGMQVNWAVDESPASDRSSCFMLRWESLPENRDQPRDGSLPEPTLLHLYKLAPGKLQEVAGGQAPSGLTGQLQHRAPLVTEDETGAKKPSLYEGRIKNLTSELRAQKSRSEDLITKYKNQQKQTAKLLARLETRYANLEGRYATLEAELAAVYSSVSWRITGPLRAVYGRLRELSNSTRRRFQALRQWSTSLVSRAASALLPYYQCYVPGRLRRMVPERARRAVARHLVSDYPGVPRRYARFELAEQRNFSRRIASLYEDNKVHFDSVKVSVIMAAYNRRDMIGRAIQSVIRQSHKNWELIIIDDGSTDGTPEVAETFLHDKRIRVVRQPHLGLSAARNSGLKRASGDIIAYLDTDNEWMPDFLRNMVVFMRSEGYQCAYAGLAALSHAGQVAYYRGREFDWDLCRAANYVDLNVYCHERRLYECGLRFDESLRRMVDWDLILQHARKVGCRVGYAPFIGCHYLDSMNDRRRVSASQPLLYKKIVQLKHSSSPGLGPKEISKQLSFDIAIKIAAPRDKRAEWGDYHYADSLAAAFRKLGHSVRIDFLGEHYDHPDGQDDVVIVLRGLASYEPGPGAVNILWVISHPDHVDYAEYDKYDLVYVASVTYPNFLRCVTRTSVRTLLQATDTTRFQPLSQKDPQYDGQVIFVGNSRNQYRKIVRWAVERGVPLAIWGTNWEQFVPTSLIKARNIDNREIGRLYASAKAVLNDHWESMAEYGFISNRLFDVLASGGCAISDAVPSLQPVFGDAVTQVRSAEELERAIERVSSEQSPESRETVARWVAANHSFDVRAKEITDDILSFLGLPGPYTNGQRQQDTQFPAPAINRHKPLNVRAFVQWGTHHPTSSAFIRLVCPLTSEALRGEVELKLTTADDASSVNKGDVCIVQRTALDRKEEAEALVDRIRKQGARLIVDNDDAFCLMDSSHPQYNLYKDKAKTLAYLMERADAVWFATPALADAYSGHTSAPQIMPNMIDPRVWRDYRQNRPMVGLNKKLRMIYMGTATHDADFGVVLPALDEAARVRPNSFELTLVGALESPPGRKWLHKLNPPTAATAYPRFARWLLQQPAWDVGLAPLADTPFNNCKSDIKFLEYGALGVIPVVSDCAAYRASATESRGAVLVKNCTDDWRDTFLNLIDGLADFRHVADAATEYVCGKRHVAALACQQVAALRRILTEPSRWLVA